MDNDITMLNNKVRKFNYECMYDTNNGRVKLRNSCKHSEVYIY